MKKFLTVLLIVLLFTLGTQGFAQKKYVIGLVCKTAGNPFFEAVNKGAQEAAKELGITFFISISSCIKRSGTN